MEETLLIHPEPKDTDMTLTMSDSKVASQLSAKSPHSSFSTRVMVCTLFSSGQFSVLNCQSNTTLLSPVLPPRGQSRPADWQVGIHLAMSYRVDIPRVKF